jgi:hypothetical protein
MRTIALILGLLGALGLHGLARAQLQPASSAEERSRHETYLLPPAATLRASSLNYTSLASDMVWVRALVYFGEVRSERRGVEFEHLDEYADTVVALDPDFYPIYNWLTATYMATRAEVTHQDLLNMNAFLDRGIARFPTSYELLQRAGLNGIGYSSQHSDADRIVELTQSIGYLERCMKLSGCPDNTAFVISWMYQRRAALLGAKDTSREQAAQQERDFSLSVYPRLTDPALRARMRKQLLDMGVEVARLDALEREQVGIVRLDYEARAPYLPLDLWALTVSPRP